MDAVFLARGLKKHGRLRSRRGFLQSGMAAAAVAALSLLRHLPQEASAAPCGTKAAEANKSEASDARLMRILRRYGSELGEVDNVRIRG